MGGNITGKVFHVIRQGAILKVLAHFHNMAP